MHMSTANKQLTQLYYCVNKALKCKPSYRDTTMATEKSNRMYIVNATYVK